MSNRKNKQENPVKVTQYLKSGEGDRSCECFRCGRKTPGYKGANDCKFAKKADNSDEKSQEFVKKSFRY